MPAETSLPGTTPLGAAADPAFDRIAGLVRTILGVPLAMVTLVDQQRQVMPGAHGLPGDLDAAREVPLSMSLCQHVVRGGEALVVTDGPADPRVADSDAVTQAGVGAYAGLPVFDSSGATVGSLCAIDFEPRAWTPAELDVLRDLAATCSTELQLRQAAERADRAQNRTRLLLELSETLATVTSVAELTERVQQVAAQSMRAVVTAITVLDADLATMSFVVTPAVAVDSPYRNYPLDADRPSATVARTGQPLFYGTVADLAAAFPAVVESARATGSAFAYLPLTAGPSVVGVLYLAWADQGDFGSADRELLMAFARYTGQALHRAQLLAERRDVAWTMQRALLPELPAVPGVEMAGRYQPARPDEAVGGDWYDAFPLDDGTLMITVGDVAGHDTAAAAAMGQLRATIRAVAIALPDAPSTILGALERVMHSFARVRVATAVFGAVRTGPAPTFTWSSAGHPPPLLLVPGAPATALYRPADPLLGVLSREPVPRTDHHVDLAPGATLVLYTDGLVERRGRLIDDGLERLLRSAEAHRDLPLPGLLDAIVADNVVERGRDDTVVFAVRLAPALGA